LWWFWGGQSWQRGWFWFSFDTFTHPFGTIIGGVFTHGHQRRDAFRQCVSFWFAIFAKTGPAFGTTGFVAGVHVHVYVYTGGSERRVSSGKTGSNTGVVGCG
jgi:hypothetical protein